MAVAPTNTLKPQLLKLSKGDYVFEEGDEAVFAYVLTEGEIDILQTNKGEEHVLGKVQKGTVFGEMAIIDGFPRSASARAAIDCKVQEVGHKEFLDYISKKPDAAFNIMTRLSGFVRSADKQASKSNLLRKADFKDPDGEEKNEKTDVVAVHDFEDTESIYAKPPSKPVVMTAVVLLLFTFLIVLWSSFSFVDKTVSARGKFTNTAPNIEIQSTGSSFIEDLNLERGQFIKKGETVAVLDGTVVNANLKIVKDQIKTLKNKILRLELQKKSILSKSLNRDSSGELDSINNEIHKRQFDSFMIQMNTFSSDIIKLDKEVASMSKDKKLMSEQLDIKIKIEKRKKTLYEKNIVSLLDKLGATDQRISASRQLLTTGASIEKLQSQKQTMIDQKKSFLTGELLGITEEISSFNDQLLKLNEELIKNKLEKSNLLVKSPVDGVVLNLPKVTVGSLINKGEPIVTLVRAGLPLVLEIDVDPKDASDLFLGNPVSVKIDALPFQQYGDVQGSLVYLSDDTVQESLQGESGAFYRGRVNVEDSALAGLPEEFDLTPGMLASADLKVGKRRLITYFTNPILKSLSSAMREPD